MPDETVILLVEDREDDILLIRKAFQRGEITNPFQIVRDGDEAIAYLQGKGKYSNRAEFPLPDLILLDLKMPRVDGFQVLRWIRTQPEFACLRVVVLTSSDDPDDVDRAYGLLANSFIVKPAELEHVVETAIALKTYWLDNDKAPFVRRWTKAECRNN